MILSVWLGVLACITVGLMVLISVLSKQWLFHDTYLWNFSRQVVLDTDFDRSSIGGFFALIVAFTLVAFAVLSLVEFYTPLPVQVEERRPLLDVR